VDFWSFGGPGLFQGSSRAGSSPVTVPIAVQTDGFGNDSAALAVRAVSEFGAALLRQLDPEDVGELRRLLGVERVRDGRLLDAPEKARQLGIHPNTLVRMAREGRISATKVGRSWRFAADTSEILPPATSPRLAIRDGGRRPRRPGAAAVSAIRGA
jgi:excisionase family DNA binding protein